MTTPAGLPGEGVGREAEDVAGLVEAWGILPGDDHAPEAHDRTKAWWFQNQRGDSLHVTPFDVARLLDFLATAPQPAPDAGLRAAAQEWADLCNDYDLNERGEAVMARLRAALGRSGSDR